MPRPHLNHTMFVVSMTVVGLVPLVGCRRPPTTGGDIPVTSERLAGSRLTDIRRDLSWTFDDTTVVIENNGQPIPSDVVQELLGNRSAPSRIEAVWRFDEQAGTLHLRDALADDEEIANDLVIAVKPAGQVRVTLGSRQYNLRRATAAAP